MATLSNHNSELIQNKLFSVLHAQLEDTTRNLSPLSVRLHNYFALSVWKQHEIIYPEAVVQLQRLPG